MDRPSGREILHCCSTFGTQIGHKSKLKAISRQDTKKLAAIMMRHFANHCAIVTLYHHIPPSHHSPED